MILGYYRGTTCCLIRTGCLTLNGLCFIGRKECVISTAPAVTVIEHRLGRAVTYLSMSMGAPVRLTDRVDSMNVFNSGAMTFYRQIHLLLAGNEQLQCIYLKWDKGSRANTCNCLLPVFWINRVQQSIV